MDAHEIFTEMQVSKGLSVSSMKGFMIFLSDRFALAKGTVVEGVCVVNRAVAPALLPKKLEQCLEVLLEQQLHPGLF